MDDATNPIEDRLIEAQRRVWRLSLFSPEWEDAVAEFEAIRRELYLDREREQRLCIQVATVE